MSKEFGSIPPERRLKITERIVASFSEVSKDNYDINAHGEAFYLLEQEKAVLQQDRRHSSRDLRIAHETYSELLTDAGKPVKNNPILLDMQEQLVLAQEREKASRIRQIRAMLNPTVLFKAMQEKDSSPAPKVVPAPSISRRNTENRGVSRRDFFVQSGSVGIRLAATAAAVMVYKKSSDIGNAMMDEEDAKVKPVYPGPTPGNDRAYADLQRKIGWENISRTGPVLLVAFISGVAMWSLPGSVILTLAGILDRREERKLLIQAKKQS